MSSSHNLAFRLACLGCGALISAATLASSVYSQTAPPIENKAQTSNRASVNTPNPSADKASNAGAASTSKRAQAYAKLLEGQRFMVATRTGGIDTRAGLEGAKRAFETATQLDATLSEPHVGLAEIAFFSSDLASAEREAQLAVKLDADNYGAHKLLSRIYTINSGIAQGELNRANTDRAIAILREVVRLNPNDTEAFTLLGELYQATNRHTEAVDALRRAASSPALIDPRFVQAVTGARGGGTTDTPLSRLASALLRAGQTTEAADTIRRALSSDPTNERYLQLLSEALTNGVSDPKPAVEELERLVRLNPDNTNAILILARTQAKNRHSEAAIKVLREAITRRATNENANATDLFELRRTLGSILTDAMRYDEARATYEDILRARNISNSPPATERDKQIAAAVFGFALETERLARRPQESRRLIERMRAVFGADDPNADIQLVSLLREENKRTEALTTVRAARRKFPEDEQLRLLEGLTLADNKQTDAAVALLREGLTDTPQDFGKYLYIASAYLQAGRAREAVAAARQAIVFAPPDSPAAKTQAMVLLSSAQERAGDIKGSEESLRLILKSEPDNALALNNLGYFLVERNERLEEAVELIERAVRAEPFNPSYLDSLGWAYFKLNRLDEAEKHLAEAARRSQTSATIHDHLGDLYHRTGRLEQARAAWRKALSLSNEEPETARIKTKLNAK